MIDKFKYWLLCHLINDQDLLRRLYIRQQIEYPIKYPNSFHGYGICLYRIKVELDD